MQGVPVIGQWEEFYQLYSHLWPYSCLKNPHQSEMLSLMIGGLLCHAPNCSKASWLPTQEPFTSVLCWQRCPLRAELRPLWVRHFSLWVPFLYKSFLKNYINDTWSMYLMRSKIFLWASQSIVGSRSCVYSAKWISWRCVFLSPTFFREGWLIFSSMERSALGKVFLLWS